MGDFFIILIKDPWYPRWEMGVMGMFYYTLYHNDPSGNTIKIQRVYTPITQPLVIDKAEEVVQHSSKVPISLTLLLLDDINPTSLSSWSFHHGLVLDLILHIAPTKCT